MKYKFILKMYKEISKSITCENEKRKHINAQTYESISSLLIQLKLEDKEHDYMFIERFLEEWYLLDMNVVNSIDKQYKIIKNFIKKLNVSEFELIKKFRLFLERYSVEAAETESISNSILCTEVRALLSTCELGVLYIPVTYKSVTLSLGQYLDSIIDIDNNGKKHPLLRYSGGKAAEFMQNVIDRDNMPIDFTEQLRTSNCVQITNRLIKGSINKKKGLLPFTTYCVFLEDLVLALHHSTTRALIEGYITEDVFKFDLMNLYESALETPTFTSNYRLCEEQFKLFFKREYLLPETGVCLEVDNGSQLLSCEYDSDLYGRSLFLFSIDKNNGVYRISNIDLESGYRLPTVWAPSYDCMLDLLKIRKYFENDCVIFHGTLGVVCNEGYKVPNKNGKLSDLSYEVFKPIYWKYRNRPKNSLGNSYGEHECLYGEKLMKLSPFKRHLPTGQNRSSEASALARKLCIELEDNETVVGSFERHQKVRIK